MGERWKDIKSYEGMYQVSDLGRVKSLHNGKVRILRYGNNGNGYLFVNLSKNNKVTNFYIHRLVAQYFLCNPENLPEVNHKDENSLNNNVNNLEWCTHKYNINYREHNLRMAESLIGKKLSQETKQKMSAIRKGRNTGANNSHAKKIICINTGVVYNTALEAKEKTNVSNTSISLCCQGKYKTAGRHPKTGEKLVWMYYKEYLKLQEAV